MGGMRNANNIVVGKPGGKRPFGRPRSRWKDNARMDFRKIGWEAVDWMHLALDKGQWRGLVNTNFGFYKRGGIS
jgi:hypothetical protein